MHFGNLQLIQIDGSLEEGIFIQGDDDFSGLLFLLAGSEHPPSCNKEGQGNGKKCKPFSCAHSMLFR